MMIVGSFALAVAALMLGNTLICAASLLRASRRTVLAPSARAAPKCRASDPFVPGYAPFVGSRLDVGAEIRVVLEALASEASDRCVAIDVAIDPNLSVHIDRDALRTIVGLLAGHAIRHAREQILVSAFRRGGRVQIAVTDDGSGVAEAEQSAMLRPVAELAALQGGTFEIEASPGQGTTAAVRLPDLVGIQQPHEQGRRTQRTPQCLVEDGEPAMEASWDI